MYIGAFAYCMATTQRIEAQTVERLEQPQLEKTSLCVVCAKQNVLKIANYFQKLLLRAD